MSLLVLYMLLALWQSKGFNYETKQCKFTCFNETECLILLRYLIAVSQTNIVMESMSKKHSVLTKYTSQKDKTL
jgi:hypothetical protein